VNILEKIIIDKRLSVAQAKSDKALEEFQHSLHYDRQTYSLKTKLANQNGPGIIAEYKRRSPSKGLINKSPTSPINVAVDYQKAGAVAVSVLTDTKYFGGTNSDLQSIRDHINIPILRKDFIIDTYQLHEAKAIGADVILLIGAVLSKDESQKLCDLAHALNLEVLYEVHDQSEISKIPENVDIVGINNRDLKAFKVDFKYSKKIYDQLPQDVMKISESGISQASTILDLHQKGFQGFLIGETFMKTADPGKSCQDFISECKTLMI